MATSSSTRQAEQPPGAPVPCREGKGEEEEEVRDWAELPVDALLAVLRRPRVPSVAPRDTGGARAVAPRRHVPGIVKVAGIDSDGFPTNDDCLKRWRLICGLIARQRVRINVKFEDLDDPMRQGLFETLKQFLEFPEGTSEAQMNRVREAAWKSIAKLHRHFKSTLV